MLTEVNDVQCLIHLFIIWLIGCWGIVMKEFELHMAFCCLVGHGDILCVVALPYV
jgi:hypothetical protein